MAGAHSDFSRCNRSDGYVVVSEDVCLGRAYQEVLVQSDHCAYKVLIVRNVIISPETEDDVIIITSHYTAYRLLGS